MAEENSALNDSIDGLADVITHAFARTNDPDDGDGRTVADGLFAIAYAISRLANAVQRLGNADAATPMGGLEALGAVMKEGMESMATSIDGLGLEVRRIKEGNS